MVRSEIALSVQTRKPATRRTAHYDAFREGLLHARSSLIDYIPLKKAGGMTWVDIGGGKVDTPCGGGVCGACG